MSDTLRAGLLFLITTVFNIYLFILTIRILLVWVQADYFNPITQFITKCTDFLVIPLRRFIPNFKRIECSSIVLLLLIEMIKFLLVCSLSFGFPNIFGLFILAIADSIKLFLETFFYAILFQAILSWIQPGSPINRVLDQFTAPIMNPFRRLIPPIGGIDISPIPALILLQLLIIILVNPLMALGLEVSI